MTSFDFEVTINSVLDRLPIDSSQITATTEPISTVRIEDWIEEATGEVGAMLTSHGFYPDDLDSDVLAIAKRAVRAYASAEGLKAFGMIGDQYSEYLGEYERIYAKFSHSPEALGKRSSSKSATRSSKSIYLDKNYQL